MNNDPSHPLLSPHQNFSPHNSVSSSPSNMQHNSLPVSTHSPSPALFPSLPHQTNHTPCPPSPQPIKSEPGTVKPEPMDTASSNSTNMVESSTMQAILAFLKKNNLTSTEEQLKAELAKMQGGASAPAVQPDTEVGNVLAAYKSDDDPTSYEAAYSDLEVFVENILDMYRH